jgi:hypothetical protein
VQLVTANVAPGLAAYACADRPASFSKILHRRTRPRHGTKPPSTLAASKTDLAYEGRRPLLNKGIGRPVGVLCSSALAIVLKPMKTYAA